MAKRQIMFDVEAKGLKNTTPHKSLNGNGTLLALEPKVELKEIEVQKPKTKAPPRRRLRRNMSD